MGIIAHGLIFHGMPERYDEIGRTYSMSRRTDPMIASALEVALGESGTVLNVGAGTGSYEPRERDVIALEPSPVMIAQRRRDAAPAVRGRAEALPFDNASFDAVMGVLTVHHWSDWRRGLAECARVARNRVVLLTWDPSIATFWLVNEYFPEHVAFDRRRFPSMIELTDVLGAIQTEPVLVPANCKDGFLGAFWRRPEAYLRPELRDGMSAFAQLPQAEARFARLKDDIASGKWHRMHADLLSLDAIDLGYRLVIAHARSH